MRQTRLWISVRNRPFAKISEERMCHDNRFPCFHCHPQSYIRMVQHLIETCLILGMSREDCVEALAEHAHIRPLITLTVWRELLKENRGFFKAYFQAISPRHLTCKQRMPTYRKRKSWK
ncbi:hypothetical protein MRB53_024493 [Persea americana]|uniref:Uncharacterized protein n=1 Tax=Persea americana TaxID=3435 RepID=A0ACC2LCI8_PERAE|nr:hypothetical protein MRB53_024493 [Persea americana]